MARVLLNIKHPNPSVEMFPCFQRRGLEGKKRRERERGSLIEVFFVNSMCIRMHIWIEKLRFKFVQSVEALIRHKYAVSLGASRIYYKLLKENETIIAKTYCQRA